MRLPIAEDVAFEERYRALKRRLERPILIWKVFLYYLPIWVIVGIMLVHLQWAAIRWVWHWWEGIAARLVSVGLMA